jgi:RND family efflux transporter MFP subunit
MSPDRQTLDELRIDRSAAPQRGLAGWVILALLLLLVAGAGIFWWLKRPKPARVRTELVQAVAATGQRTLLNASGYVTARRRATVSAKITGKVVEVLVEEGMKVEAGQVLARLDASNLEASLRLTRAQLESARKAVGETQASRDQAERELRRVSRLAEEKIASPSEYDRAESDLRTLTARIERQQAEIVVAEREVDLWQQQVDDTVIRAPFAGIATSKDAQPGEMISPVSAGGGFTRTGICTLVDMNSLEIEVDVNESYINRVLPGQPVESTLDAYPDWRIPSKVIAIIPAADRQKATVKVRVGFDQLDARILPDMGVKVAFQTKDQGVSSGRSLVVPKAALRREGGKDILWVVNQGRIERRAVTGGGVQGDQVTIAGGLTGGERIVVEGPQDLTEGAGVVEAEAKK